MTLFGFKIENPDSQSRGFLYAEIRINVRSSPNGFRG